MEGIRKTHEVEEKEWCKWNFHHGVEPHGSIP